MELTNCSILLDCIGSPKGNINLPFSSNKQDINKSIPYLGEDSISFCSTLAKAIFLSLMVASGVKLNSSIN
jgi:hypothetical protein